MIIRDITPTPGLLAMLRSRADGTNPLAVFAPAQYCAPAGADMPPGLARTIIVLRADGSELSETEAAHVRATIAAHQVQPL